MKSRRPSKKGIALVITLGFLAVIALLAVSFAVTMRVERLVARSYADRVRARELAHSALGRAILQVHSDAASKTWFYPTYTNIFVSAGGGASAPRILSGVAANYLPTSLVALARAQTNNVSWISFSAGGKVVGRYAYMIVNTSGLLDVNLNYDTPATLPRGWGVNPDEIAFFNAILPEVKTPRNIVDARRSAIGASPAFGRIETHAEILPVLAYGYANAQPLQQPPLYPGHFTSFSYFPLGFVDGTTVLQPVYIGGSVSDIDWAKVQDAFKAMGLSDARAKAAADNLRDYLDNDRVPRELDSICTEPVPMINEVIIKNQVVFDGSVWKNRVSFGIETWYPFGAPTDSTGSYSVQITGVSLVGGSFVGTSQNSGALALDGGDPLQGPRDFRRSTHTFEWSTADATPPTMPNALQIGEIAVFRGSEKVDRIAGSITLTWGDHFHAVAPGALWIGSSWEVDDPRINWNWSRDWEPPRQKKVDNPMGTFGNMNSRVSYAAKDGHPVMYVRNTDNLKVVGELGFLLYDETKPWETIPLLGTSKLTEVLDRFTTSNRPFRRGLVNPSSDIRNVLATVFYDMPIERYPGESGAMRISTKEQADLVAKALISARPNGGFVNLSGICGMAIPIGGLDRLQQKSIIRNSAGLFSVRQNLFTIIVWAQSGTDLNNNNQIEDSEVTGEAKAVALVWRDPYPESGMHRTFVRYMKWLDD